MANDTALTPEEWRAGEHTSRYAHVWRDYGPDRIDVTPGKHSPHVSSIDFPDDLCALIALANAALPDDDPRKITRADVTALRHIDHSSFCPEDPCTHGCDHAKALRVAAKLAALLPPE